MNKLIKAFYVLGSLIMTVTFVWAVASYTEGAPGHAELRHVLAIGGSLIVMFVSTLVIIRVLK